MKRKLNFKGIGLIALSLLAGISFILPSASTCAAKATTNDRKIKIAYFETASFQEGKSEDDIKSGYAYEVYQKIADYTGWEYEYVYGSWTNLYSQFINGEIDLFARLAKTPERTEYMEWSNYSIGEERHSIFVGENDTSIIDGDINSLKGKRLGIVSNNYLSDVLTKWCEDNNITLRYKYYEDVPLLQEALDQNEIDAYVCSENNVLIDYNARVFANLSSTDSFIAVKKDDYDLFNQLNGAMMQINSNEPRFYEDLAKKYYSRSLVNAVLSTEEKEWVDSHSVLKIGFENEYMPFSGVKEDGTVDGVMIDIVDEWTKSLKLQSKFSIQYIGYNNYDELFKGLDNNEIDIIFPIIDNVGYAEKQGITCSTSMVSSSIVAVYKGTFTEDKLNSIAYSSHSIMQEICSNVFYPDAKKVVFDGRDGCLDAVKNGTVGCTLFNSTRGEMAIREKDYKSLKLMSLGKTVDYSFAVRKGDRALLSLVNKGLALTNSSAFTNKSFDYVHLTSTYEIYDFLRDYGIWVIVALLITGAGITIMQVVHSTRMKKALAATKEANESKSSFFFNMSHDIRTPMNAILGFTDMGIKYIDDKDKVEDCLVKTKRAGTLLLSLINNVLDMSRIEANISTLDEKPGDVMLSFTNIENTMVELGKTKNISVEFEYGEITDRYVYADFTKTTRVFTNLISNAIKYTNQGGSVVVRCEQIGKADGGFATIRYIVKDNGIGMSDEFQKHMFESFSREKNITTTQVEGNGLGLSVVKTFVDFLGGKIECQSSINEGTTFIVTFPFRIQEGKSYIDPNTGKLMSSNDVEEKETSIKLAGKHVLLVDDNTLNVEIAKDLLEEEGLLVDTAYDGELAVNTMRKKGPNYYDFILMDIQMPVMDGYEATMEIRDMYPNDDIIIIALSANAFAEDKEASLQAGMNDHLSKPIDKNLLIKVLNEQFKRVNRK